MTEGQKAEILDWVQAADAATRFRVAEAIRQFPDTPLNDVLTPVSTDPTAWAEVYIESLKLRERADYTEALAWFYAEHMPTDALLRLIETKQNVIKRGEMARKFWKMMEGLKDG